MVVERHRTACGLEEALFRIVIISGSDTRFFIFMPLFT
jgi:hypothetical protein